MGADLLWLMAVAILTASSITARRRVLKFFSFIFCYLTSSESFEVGSLYVASIISFKICCSSIIFLGASSLSLMHSTGGYLEPFLLKRISSRAGAKTDLITSSAAKFTLSDFFFGLKFFIISSHPSFASKSGQISFRHSRTRETTCFSVSSFSF